MEAWVKVERTWEEKERELEDRVELLEKEVRKGRERVSTVHSAVGEDHVS